MRTRACTERRPLCVLATVRWCCWWCGWAALLASGRADDACPQTCACARDSGTVSCLGDSGSGLPSHVPVWTSTLILRGRNVTTLRGGAFATTAEDGGELPAASALSLSGNSIRAIEADAFAGLPHLHLLDLSHNRVERISDGAFRGLRELRTLCLNETLAPESAAQLSAALAAGDLRSLHRLELTGNRLRSVPLARLDAFQQLHQLVLVNNSIRSLGRDNVSGLERQRRTRVYLANNPFRCTCELEAFYWWLKNGSQCADVALLRCAEPEARRGLALERLRAEDVDCLNENLEAVSYVFLGIVLALIGLVFLMVLYLNRGGIKRWLNNIREACRDQMEVYHYRYEQDSDPRLANVAV
nr:trophoblast glycoprotein-like [Nerophis lumbriciformis]